MNRQCENLSPDVLGFPNSSSVFRVWSWHQSVVLLGPCSQRNIQWGQNHRADQHDRPHCFPTARAMHWPPSFKARSPSVCESPVRPRGFSWIQYPAKQRIGGFGGSLYPGMGKMFRCVSYDTVQAESTRFHSRAFSFLRGDGAMKTGSIFSG